MNGWLHDLRVGWGQHAHDAASEVSPAIALGKFGDLHTIGRSMAAAGSTLEEVLAWYTHLSTRSRRFRRVFEQGGLVNLASGWAEGALQKSFDLQSPAPVDLLRLRAQQAASSSRGGEASAHPLALVVIEAQGPAGCQARVSEHAREVFNAGETMAATAPGVVLVLVHRNQAARGRSLRLLDAMRLDDQLRGTTVRVWIEPLAMSAEHLDSHLLGLVS